MIHKACHFANTREAIWDAMARKEVYATSGPRIRVRVFAGYDFEESDVPRSDFAAHGCLNSVPMGGELGNGNGRASRILIRALRGPDGSNSGRVKALNCWLDAGSGEPERKVDDVSLGGDHTPDANLLSPPVGNTVELSAPSKTNTIESTERERVWEDPEFDPLLSASYDARVLETPTPNWKANGAVRCNTEKPQDVYLVIQKRAYVSPIRYMT